MGHLHAWRVNVLAPPPLVLAITLRRSLGGGEGAKTRSVGRGLKRSKYLGTNLSLTNFSSAYLTIIQRCSGRHGLHLGGVLLRYILELGPHASTFDMYKPSCEKVVTYPSFTKTQTSRKPHREVRLYLQRGDFFVRFFFLHDLIYLRSCFISSYMSFGIASLTMHPHLAHDHMHYERHLQCKISD